MNQALMNLVCLKTSWNSMFLYIFLVFGFSSLFYFAGARSFLRWSLNTVKFLVVCMRLTILLYASCIVYTLTTSPPCSDEKALQAIDKLVSRSDQFSLPIWFILKKNTRHVTSFSCVRERLCAYMCVRWEGGGGVSSIPKILICKIKQLPDFPNR